MAAAFLALLALMAVLEAHSEHAKLARGAFTDTFRPTLVSELLTWPWSGLHPGPDYPVQFDAARYGAVLDADLRALLLPALMQACTVGVVAVSSHRRGRRNQSGR